MCCLWNQREWTVYLLLTDINRGAVLAPKKDRWPSHLSEETCLSPSFWTIFLRSGANVASLDIRCNAIVHISMRAHQRECVCKRESCCQAKQGRFSFFNTKMGTKLSKCIFANWWLGAIISWWQIWKDPLDISIKPCEKTPPQRYCALSVEWTTFCICHNVQFLWESPPIWLQWCINCYHAALSNSLGWEEICLAIDYRRMLIANEI